MKYLICLLSCIPAILFLFLTFFINYQDGYYYYEESEHYLINYLTDKPILEKLFDYRVNDTLLYRQRELGNVFNMIDAYLLSGSIRMGFIHVLSILHFIVMFVIAVSPFIYVLKAKITDYKIFFITVFLGLLFLSSTSPFFTTFYFRTSKQVVAGIAAVFLWLLWELYKTKRNVSLLPYGIIYAVIFSMGIIDETGIVLGIFFTAYTGFVFLFQHKSRKNIGIVISSVLGVGSIFFYRTFVSPFIVQRVVGYIPEKWELSALPADIVKVLLQGSNLLISYMSSITRGIPPVFILPLVLLVCAVLAHAFVKKNTTHYKLHTAVVLLCAVLFFSVGFGGISLMLGLMGVHFPPVYFEHTQLIYYPLPFAAVWFVLIAAAIYYVLSKMPKSVYVFMIVLPVLVVINIFSLSYYHAVLKNTEIIKKYYGAAFPVMQAIQQKDFDLKESGSIPGGEIIQVFKDK